MKRSWTYRVLLYAAVSVIAGLTLVPSVAGWLHRPLPSWFKSVFSRKIALGTDLQGGYQIQLVVNLDKPALDTLDLAASDVRDLLTEQKVEGISIQRFGDKQDDARLDVVVPSTVDKKKLQALVARLHLVLAAAQGQTHTYRVNPEYLNELEKHVIDQSIEKIRARVDNFGVREAGVRRGSGNKILIELPGVSVQDRDRLLDVVGRTAQLEFKIVDDADGYMQKLLSHVGSQKGQIGGVSVETEEKDGSGERYVYASTKDTLDAFVKGLPAELQPAGDHELLYGKATGKSAQDIGWRIYYLFKKTELTGNYLRDAEVVWTSPEDNVGSSAKGKEQPAVSVEFNSKGASRFEKLTGENVQKRMAIVLEGMVESAPVIKAKLSGGKATITLGRGTPTELLTRAKELKSVLRTGALPAPLTKDTISKIGPSLGSEVVAKARLAMLIGSLAVILFMLVYYRGAGLVANIAMVLNLVYLLAIMALFESTLTLPGIAAVVLTVGMAVDANIIIYERIREELRAGKAPRSSVDTGFKRAFWTVFDAHVTNLVAGVVLYSYGSTAIRGFAVSLIAGIVCNLFTSVWLSRAFFEWIVGRKKTNHLSI